MAENRPKTERSDSEMDTEAGGEEGISQSQSRHKKGHMTNIYFVKDHKVLYDKTNKHFEDKDRKECLWKRFTSTHKLSVKVCKTWFKSERTCTDENHAVIFYQVKAGDHQNSLLHVPGI